MPLVPRPAPHAGPAIASFPLCGTSPSFTARTSPSSWGVGTAIAETSTGQAPGCQLGVPSGRVAVAGVRLAHRPLKWPLTLEEGGLQLVLTPAAQTRTRRQVSSRPLRRTATEPGRSGDGRRGQWRGSSTAAALFRRPTAFFAELQFWLLPRAGTPPRLGNQDEAASDACDRKTSSNPQAVERPERPRTVRGLRDTGQRLKAADFRFPEPQTGLSGALPRQRPCLSCFQPRSSISSTLRQRRPSSRGGSILNTSVDV